MQPGVCMSKPLVTCENPASAWSPAVRRLESYAFPGNVRELQGLVERAAPQALGEGQHRLISEEHLWFAKKQVCCAVLVCACCAVLETDATIGQATLPPPPALRLPILPSAIAVQHAALLTPTLLLPHHPPTHRRCAMCCAWTC